MSPTTRSIDARGLPCPQPVILARKALAEGGFDLLELRVDTPSAPENLVKFATYAKCEVSLQEGAGETLVRITPAGGAAPACDITPELEALSARRAAVVLITAEGIGQGDADLGRLLMKGFLYTLTESDHPPRTLLFMNGGVKLAVSGSPALEHLKALAEGGTEVLSCGTCLDAYGLKESLAVGGVTNMYDIAAHLLEGPSLTLG